MVVRDYRMTRIATQRNSTAPWRHLDACPAASRWSRAAGVGGFERRDVARGAAELDPDQVDRFAAAPVLRRVVALLQLRQRRPGRRHFLHLELEQVYVPVRAHRHVQPPVAARLFHRDLVSQRREVGVEDAGMEALVLGDVVVGVPLIGNARVERVEQLLQPGAVVRLQQPHQSHAVRRLPVGILHQVQQQLFVQALAHLPVRVAEPIQRLASQPFLPRDRQVAGLEQQCLGFDVLHVERR